MPKPDPVLAPLSAVPAELATKPDLVTAPPAFVFSKVRVLYTFLAC